MKDSISSIISSLKEKSTLMTEISDDDAKLFEKLIYEGLLISSKNGKIKYRKFTLHITL